MAGPVLFHSCQSIYLSDVSADILQMLVYMICIIRWIAWIFFEILEEAEVEEAGKFRG